MQCWMTGGYALLFAMEYVLSIRFREDTPPSKVVGPVGIIDLGFSC